MNQLVCDIIPDHEFPSESASSALPFICRSFHCILLSLMEMALAADFTVSSPPSGASQRSRTQTQTPSPLDMAGLCFYWAQNGLDGRERQAKVQHNPCLICEATQQCAKEEPSQNMIISVSTNVCVKLRFFWGGILL